MCAQAADTAVACPTGNAGVGRREATHGTEVALRQFGGLGTGSQGAGGIGKETEKDCEEKEQMIEERGGKQSCRESSHGYGHLLPAGRSQWYLCAALCVTLTLSLSLLILMPSRFGSVDRTLSDLERSVSNLTESVSLHLSKLHEKGEVGCPDGWYLHNSSCYFFSAYKASWYTARDSCRDMDATLLILTDEEEWGFVNRISNGRYFWLGLSDERTGEWEWVNGSPYIMDRRQVQLSHYDKWVPGQPDNWAGHSIGGTEDCAHISISGKLNDNHCTSHLSLPSSWVLANTNFSTSCSGSFRPILPASSSDSFSFTLNRGLSLSSNVFCHSNTGGMTGGDNVVKLTLMFWRFQQVSLMLTLRSNVTQQRRKNLTLDGEVLHNLRGAENDPIAVLLSLTFTLFFLIFILVLPFLILTLLPLCRRQLQDAQLKDRGKDRGTVGLSLPPARLIRVVLGSEPAFTTMSPKRHGRETGRDGVEEC
ncbi:unnamed protein product [Coregonus sp. 'balchen']|nr:unnamed protein product [Coregonus sp. 'balchen']